MGNITELRQGSLDGLRRQLNECIENAYNKGYVDGKKEPKEEHEEYIRELINKAKQEGYDTGYNEGLENARKYINKLYQYGLNELQNYFDETSIPNIICRTSITDIIASINLYEEKKKAEEEIKVGDIVVWEDGKKDFPFIVTLVKCQTYVAINKEGGFTYFSPNAKLKKIGNVSDKLQTLIDKLKGDK